MCVELSAHVISAKAKGLVMRIRQISEITEIVLHCSASNNNKDNDISAIKHLHTAPRTETILWGKYKTYGKAWDDVGYHHFVTTYGSVQPGRDELIQGAGVRGHNRNTLHICLSGDDNFFGIQFLMLYNLVKRICEDYPITKISYHGDYDEHKTCPNFTRPWVEKFNATGKF